MKHFLIALAALLALAPAAHAVRNGDIVYSWSRTDVPELGPFHYMQEIRLVSPRGGTPRAVAGCEQTVARDAPDSAVTCDNEFFIDPAVSRDGARIAFDDGASLALVDMDGSNLTALPATSQDDAQPTFSAAGGRIAYAAGHRSSGSGGDGRQIWVRDLARGTTRRIAGGEDPAWSSRNWIAYVDPDAEEIWMVRPGGHGNRRLTDGFDPAWSPDGRKLAFTRSGAILVLDLRTRRVRRVAHRLDATDVAWSPDGRRLAYALFDGGIETIGVDGSRPRTVVSGGVGGAYSLQAQGIDWQPLR